MIERYIYRCTYGGSDATGFPSPGGFTVMKGSTISSKVAPSFECASKFYYNLREQLINDGIIKDGIFQQNYEFKSATAAASVAVGWTISGTSAWKTYKRIEI